MSDNIERAAEVTLPPAPVYWARALVSTERPGQIGFERAYRSEDEAMDHQNAVAAVKLVALTDEQARLVRLGKAVEGQAEMLRRAAQACMNVAPLSSSNWFAWVPAQLSNLADRLDAAAERAT